MSTSYYQEYKRPMRMGIIIVFISSAFLIIILSILTSDSNLKNAGSAHLEINIGDHKRAFEGEVVDGMTLLEAIQASALAGNIVFNYKMDNDEDEIVIMSLNGYRYGDGGGTLSLYINNQKIDSNKVHSTLIKHGDAIVIKTE